VGELAPSAHRCNLASLPSRPAASKASGYCGQSHRGIESGGRRDGTRGECGTPIGR
jgi:hypothetical protein